MKFWCVKIDNTKVYSVTFYPVWIKYIFFAWNGRYNIIMHKELIKKWTHGA